MRSEHPYTCVEAASGIYSLGQTQRHRAVESFDKYVPNWDNTVLSHEVGYGCSSFLSGTNEIPTCCHLCQHLRLSTFAIEVWFYCGLGFPFSDDWWHWASFWMLYGHSYVFFRKNYSIMPLWAIVLSYGAGETEIDRDSRLEGIGYVSVNTYPQEPQPLVSEFRFQANLLWNVHHLEEFESGYVGLISWVLTTQEMLCSSLHTVACRMMFLLTARSHTWQQAHKSSTEQESCSCLLTSQHHSWMRYSCDHDNTGVNKPTVHSGT